MKSILCTLLWILSLGSVLNAQEWTRFRGPDGQGIASGTAAIPAKWSAENIRWKTALPGQGHSSPVIWGKRVFVTACDPGSASCLALGLDADTGAIAWQRSYKVTDYRMNNLNSYAASTPAVDEDYVYLLWPTAADVKMTVLTHAGEPVWEKSFGSIVTQHGPSISPILYRDMVIFTQEQEADDQDLKSRWLALERKTGAIRWELPRRTERTSYSTPCVYTDAAGTEQLIFSSIAHGITAVEPLTGKVLWELPEVFNCRTVSSPVIADGKIIATCGAGSTGKMLVVVQPPTADEPAKVVRTIENRLVPYVPTSVYYHDRLYTFHDQGQVSCWDLDQEKPLWTEKPAGLYYGSPVAVGDTLFCMNRKGQVVALAAGDEYKLLAVNDLNEETQATPAIARGRLYLRTLKTLTCVGMQ